MAACWSTEICVHTDTVVYSLHQNQESAQKQAVAAATEGLKVRTDPASARIQKGVRRSKVTLPPDIKHSNKKS